MTIGGTAPSITSNDALAIAAGGTNKNVVLTPSGTGYTLLGGNVGIGTASPVSRLHVGAAASATANYGLVSLGNGPFDGTTAGYFGTSTTSNANGTILAANVAAGYTGDLMNMQVNGLSKFKVDKDGKILLYGSFSEGRLYYNSDNIFVENYRFSNTANINFRVWGGSVANDAMTVTGAGNVGIGTTTPSSLLQVSGGSTTVTRSALATTSADGLVLENTTAATAVVTQLSPALHFKSSGWSQTSSASVSSDALLELLPVASSASYPTLHLKWQNNGGAYTDGIVFSSSGNEIWASATSSFGVDLSPTRVSFGTSNATEVGVGTNGLVTAGTKVMGFAAAAVASTPTADTAFSRLAGGSIGIGNGTQGDYSGTLIVGNVGIGTTSPSSKLDVRYNTTAVTEPRSDVTFAAKIVNPLASAFSGGLEVIGGGNGNATSPILTVGSFSGENMMNVYDGSVMIGNQSGVPGGLLEVSAGNAKGFATAIVSSNYSGYGSAAAQIIARNASGAFTISLDASGASNDASITNTLNAPMIFGTNNSERMRLDASGNLGIGTSPNEKLEVNGNIRLTPLNGGGTTTATIDNNGNIIRTPSDERLKTQIQPLEGSLARILKVQGVSYYWKNQENFGSARDIGFIAQDLEKVVPEVVRQSADSEHRRSVSYANMVALLVEALKEMYLDISGEFASLRNQNEALKAHNIQLENKSAELEKRSAALESWACSQSSKPTFCKQFYNEDRRF